MSISKLLNGVKGRTGIQNSILLTGTTICLLLSNMIVSDFQGAASASTPPIQSLSQNSSDTEPRYELGEMVLVFDSSRGQVQFEVSGEVNLHASWGEGATHCEDSIVGAQLVTCKVSGETTVVRLTGELESFGPDETRAHKGVDRLLSVHNWEGVELKNLENAFWGAHRLQQVPGDLPHNISSLKNTFRRSGYAGEDVSSWDVSGVTDLSYVFAEASAFDADLKNWDTSSVRNFEGAFKSARSFNQPLPWDTSSGENFSKMFNGAVAFNQSLELWDVSKAKGMERMFARARSFDQDLSGWCVKQFVEKHQNHLVGVVEVGSPPEQFDFAASKWMEGRPVWGECPGQD